MNISLSYLGVHEYPGMCDGYPEATPGSSGNTSRSPTAQGEDRKVGGWIERWKLADGFQTAGNEWLHQPATIVGAPRSNSPIGRENSMAIPDLQDSFHSTKEGQRISRILWDPGFPIDFA